MSEHQAGGPPEAEHKPFHAGTTLGEGEPMSPDEILQVPIFEGASKGLLEKNMGAVVRRRFRPGEVVCREGEFGSTAFYILEGTAEVYITSPIAHVKTDQTRLTTIFTNIKSKLAGRKADVREEESRNMTIAIDAPVDLKYDSPTAELKTGDIFGEMTCMNFYPRSATVRAKTECVMLEMLRNILDILQKLPKFKAQLDKAYKERALEDHLRGVPMFAALTAGKNLPEVLKGAEFVQRLRQNIELVRFAPGQVICKQGDTADSFYLVRIGFVRVSQTYPGGEMVLAYLSRGNHFGEIGLLGGGLRTATCTALDHVELVRIKGDDFKAMIEEFPAVREAVEKVSRERQDENRQQARLAASVPIDDFLSQGLMEAGNLLILDLKKCTRCDQCVRACADTHENVTRLVREGLRFENHLVATSCRQCRDPLCMVGCPVGSIRRRNSLEIIIEDWCIGCGLCAKNCPYGNINMHPVEDPEAVQAEAKVDKEGRVIKPKLKQKATTCDLCSDLDEPSCVYACPHDAAHRVNPRAFFGIKAAKDSTRKETVVMTRGY